jgi:hypothetical protein
LTERQTIKGRRKDKRGGGKADR